MSTTVCFPNYSSENVKTSSIRPGSVFLAFFKAIWHFLKWFGIFCSLRPGNPVRVQWASTLARTKFSRHLVYVWSLNEFYSLYVYLNEFYSLYVYVVFWKCVWVFEVQVVVVYLRCVCLPLLLVLSGFFSVGMAFFRYYSWQLAYVAIVSQRRGRFEFQSIFGCVGTVCRQVNHCYFFVVEWLSYCNYPT